MRSKAPLCVKAVQNDRARDRQAIIYRPISELRIDSRNPRLQSPKQIRQIANGISAFRFNVPILIDDNLKVIAGHGRISACQLLGWAEVPTIRLDDLNEAQAPASMIDKEFTAFLTRTCGLLARYSSNGSIHVGDAIIDATGRGDVVLDPFLLSGSPLSPPPSAPDATARGAPAR